MKFRNTQNPPEDQQDFNEQDDYNQDDYNKYDEIEQEFEPDEDEFYTRDELELQEKHKQRRISLENFKDNARSGFGLDDKMDNLWDKIRFGSTGVKVGFILALLATFVIFILLAIFVF